MNASVCPSTCVSVSMSFVKWCMFKVEINFPFYNTQGLQFIWGVPEICTLDHKILD